MKTPSDKERILKYLSTHPGFTLPEIAEATGVGKSHVSTFVKKLKKDNLVENVGTLKNPKGRRPCVVYKVSDSFQEELNQFNNLIPYKFPLIRRLYNLYEYTSPINRF